MEISTEPTIFICATIYLSLLVVFILWRCDKMQNELNEYMDKKIDEFKKESKQDFNQIKESIENIKTKKITKW